MLEIFKTVHSQLFNDEFNIARDENGYYIVPTNKTSLDTLAYFGIKKGDPSKSYYKLLSPTNYQMTWGSVADVDEINGVLAIICERGGYLSIHPAIENSDYAMECYVKDLNTKGDFGDYIRVKCMSCGNFHYFNQKDIPLGEMFEIECPNCKSVTKRKRIA